MTQYHQITSLKWSHKLRLYSLKRKHRQLVLTGVINLDYILLKENIADPLTKGLKRNIVEKSSRGTGLKPLEN